MKVGFVATIDGRESIFEKMKESIINQVDMLIVVYRSPSDGFKFFGADRLQGYVFVLDDDILYPSDYVDEMIKAVEKYGRNAVICCSGKIMKPRPINDFYADEFKCLKTFERVEKDTVVEIPLTCAIAYHTDGVLHLCEHEMLHPNMADINLAIYCKQMGIPVICKAHSTDWLTNLMPELPPGTFTIFDSFRGNTSKQVELINAYL